jgi:uncharacterized membrane-anchored protein
MYMAVFHNIRRIVKDPDPAETVEINNQKEKKEKKEGQQMAPAAQLMIRAAGKKGRGTTLCTWNFPGHIQIKSIVFIDHAHPHR